MAEINATNVAKLREMTGVGMMECKRALDEANGEMEQAFTVLRKRGLASAAKKAGAGLPTTVTGASAAASSPTMNAPMSNAGPSAVW